MMLEQQSAVPLAYSAVCVLTRGRKRSQHNNNTHMSFHMYTLCPRCSNAHICVHRLFPAESPRPPLPLPLPYVATQNQRTKINMWRQRTSRSVDALCLTQISRRPQQTQKEKINRPPSGWTGQLPDGWTYRRPYALTLGGTRRTGNVS